MCGMSHVACSMWHEWVKHDDVSLMCDVMFACTSWMSRDTCASDVVRHHVRMVCHVSCYMSCVSIMCHMSRVMNDVSCAMYHISCCMSHRFVVVSSVLH